MMEFNKNRIFTAISVFMFLLFLAVIIKNAWVCDDSYITFRTLDNFVNGYGLRWNIDSRVQAYTNTLWLFLLTPFYYLTREIYYTSILISIYLSMSVVFLIDSKIKINSVSAVTGYALLAASSSFTDFSTSGLENPFSHFLFALFISVYFSQKDLMSFFKLCLIAGMIMLNRFDHGIIVIPFIADVFFRNDNQEISKKRKAAVLFAGFSLFLIWIVFSIIYYGFPFPNTAYAKLNTGIDRISIIKQGLAYVVDFIKNDYAGVIALAAGTVLSFPYKQNRSNTPFFCALVLYMFYIVFIGGDFMSGRFFTILILISVIIIARKETNIYISLFTVTVVIALSLLNPHSSIASWTDFSDLEIKNGIADERGYYFKYTGLFNGKPFSSKPVDPFKNKGRKYRHLIIKDGVGFSGFNAGPKFRILDRYALGEPLLARIPYKMPHEVDKSFRPGHLARKFPDGYVDTYKTGKNMLKDPDLRKYYRIMSNITAGDIFTVKRMNNIIKINTGGYDHLIKKYIKRERDRAVKKVPVSIGSFSYEEKDCGGIKCSGVTISWRGNSSGERYLIDWIDPDGRCVFSKYIYEHPAKNEKWYQYLGDKRMKPGKWTIRVSRIAYKDVSPDVFIGEKTFVHSDNPAGSAL